MKKHSTVPRRRVTGFAFFRRTGPMGLAMGASRSSQDGSERGGHRLRCRRRQLQWQQDRGQGRAGKPSNLPFVLALSGSGIVNTETREQN